MSRTYKQLFIMLAIFLVGWAAFALISFFNHDEESSGKLLSADREEKTAWAIHNLIMDEYDTIDLPASSLAVQQIFDRFSENVDTSQNYHFYIIDDGMNNAFATLNGNIYIMRGLLDFSESPEILSAVIAHEIGHIEHRDFESRLTKNISLSAMEMIITGGNTTLISELSRTLFSSKYDRHQEQDADDFAKDLLIKSGIHPENIGVLFLAMQRESEFDLPQGADVFMSHPHLKQRIEKAVNYDLPEDFVEIPLNVDWESVKEELKNN